MLDAMATAGEVAYEAYREAYEACKPEATASEDRLPAFRDLPSRVRVAFEASAQAVCRRYGAIY